MVVAPSPVAAVDFALDLPTPSCGLPLRVTDQHADDLVMYYELEREEIGGAKGTRRVSQVHAAAVFSLAAPTQRTLWIQRAP